MKLSLEKRDEIHCLSSTLWDTWLSRSPPVEEETGDAQNQNNNHSPTDVVVMGIKQSGQILRETLRRQIKKTCARIKCGK